MNPVGYIVSCDIVITDAAYRLRKHISDSIDKQVVLAVWDDVSIVTLVKYLIQDQINHRQ